MAIYNALLPEIIAEYRIIAANLFLFFVNQSCYCSETQNLELKNSIILGSLTDLWEEAQGF